MNKLIFENLYSFGQNYPGLDGAIVFLADKLGYLLILGLIYFLFTHGDKKRGVREIALMILVSGSAWLIAHAVKAAYPLDRPFVAIEGLRPLFPHEADGSLPSGHATFYSALAMAMYFYNRRLAIILAIGALLIGISRIAAGVHWPTDIFAGFILGSVVVHTTYFLIGKNTRAISPGNTKKH